MEEVLIIRVMVGNVMKLALLGVAAFGFGSVCWRLGSRSEVVHCCSEVLYISIADVKG